MLPDHCIMVWYQNGFYYGTIYTPIYYLVLYNTWVPYTIWSYIILNCMVVIQLKSNHGTRQLHHGMVPEQIAPLSGVTSPLQIYSRPNIISYVASIEHKKHRYSQTVWNPWHCCRNVCTSFSVCCSRCLLFILHLYYLKEVDLYLQGFISTGIYVHSPSQ